MIVDGHIAEYIRSLEPEIPEYLHRLEERALAENVPIIRKDAQAFLRFLLRLKQPQRILEVGTAVGFSCMYMAEYMPKDALIATIEKVAMRLVPAKENLKESPYAKRIALLEGDAADVLRFLAKEEVEHIPAPKVYFPAGNACAWHKAGFWQQYDFIFMDAAKAQYMSYLPYILQLLKKDGLLLTDNVLQEGSIAESKFAVARRERTIHVRMREYLYELTHRNDLNTTILPIGDGMALTSFL